MSAAVAIGRRLQSGLQAAKAPSAISIKRTYDDLEG